MKTLKFKDGINFNFIEDGKFKTAALTVNFLRPLNKDEVTFNSLIPSVVRRGSQNYPDTLSLNRYLDSLYGADFTSGIRKNGETQIITFSFKTVSDKYAQNCRPFSKLIELMGEVLFNPLVKDGGFDRDFTEREKENLSQLIESVINDKREYAKKRLIEEMYKNSPYGIFEYGYISDLEKIDGKNLYEHYLKVVSQSRIEVFVTGAFDKEEVTEELKKVFEKITVVPIKLSKPERDSFNKDINYIYETAPVTQGKLSMGFKTNITANDPDYFAILAANNLFGGSVHSKLFLNVREKLSLAYYAGSSYSSFKGFINVNCGIECDKFDVTVKEVFNQFEDMKQGKFTKEELEFTKFSLTTTYQSSGDSMGALEDYYLSQKILGTENTIDSCIKKINEVTKEEVIEAIRKAKPDTVFFLKGGAAL